MKYLSLIRHAHAKKADASISDTARPLKKRGYDELDSISPNLEVTDSLLVLCSVALRAQQTAEHLLDTLSIQRDVLRINPMLYSASAGDVVSVIKALDSPASHLWLVGHNPTLTDTVNILCGSDSIHDMAAGSVAIMTLAIDSWHDTCPGVATLVKYQEPV